MSYAQRRQGEPTSEREDRLVLVLLTGLAGAALVFCSAFDVTSQDVDLFQLGIGLFVLCFTLAAQKYRSLP